MQAGRRGPARVGAGRLGHGFKSALLRLEGLLDNQMDTAGQGPGILRELFCAVLRGETGAAAKLAFEVGNEILRTIDYLPTRLNEPITIDDLAPQVGMNRAMFHRPSKEATSTVPIQFVKSMQMINAAMRTAGDMNVSEATWDVANSSSSWFSRECKRYMVNRHGNGASLHKPD